MFCNSDIEVWRNGARGIFLCAFYIYVDIYVCRCDVIRTNFNHTNTSKLCRIIDTHDIVWPPYVFEKKIQLDEGRPAAPAWPKAPSEIRKKALI